MKTSIVCGASEPQLRRLDSRPSGEYCAYLAGGLGKTPFNLLEAFLTEGGKPVERTVHTEHVITEQLLGMDVIDLVDNRAVPAQRFQTFLVVLSCIWSFAN